MQLVGKICTRCHKSVVAAATARWCGGCDLVFHEGCTSDGTVCPLCGEPFSAWAKEAREREARQIQEDLAAGRKLLLLCFFLLLVPNVLAIAALLAFPSQDGSDLLRVLMNTVASVLLFWGVYAGRKWARTLLIVGLALSSGLLAAMWFSYLVLLSGKSEISVAGLSILSSLALLLGLQVVVLGILACSQRVRWFLESQAPRAD